MDWAGYTITASFSVGSTSWSDNSGINCQKPLVFASHQFMCSLAATDCCIQLCDYWQFKAQYCTVYCIYITAPSNTGVMLNGSAYQKISFNPTFCNFLYTIYAMMKQRGLMSLQSFGYSTLLRMMNISKATSLLLPKVFFYSYFLKLYLPLYMTTLTYAPCISSTYLRQCIQYMGALLSFCTPLLKVLYLYFDSLLNGKTSKKCLLAFLS